MLGKKSIRWTAIVALSVAVCVGLGGCGTDKASNNSSMNAEAITFPLETPETLRYWCPMPANGLNMADYNDSELYKELEKRTGVKIVFEHPPAGHEKEQLGIILSSGDMPDIIENDFGSYSGGILKAYSNGIVMELNELQEKYAPNLTAIYEKYPGLMYNAKTEDGKFLRVPFIRGNGVLRTSRGPIVRKDWLDELGLPVPETMDEWYNTLKQFKEKKGATAPFVTNTFEIRGEAMMGAYGLNNVSTGNYMLDDGKVIFCPIDPRYKEYLTEMAKWFREGLIDPDFALNNSRAVDEMVTNGQAGATVGYVGATIGRYMGLMSEADPNFKLVGAPYPVLEKGDTPTIMHQEEAFNTNGCASITTAAKNPALAMAWLDYAFSKEGHKLFNFGIEGVSYEMVDGFPKYTDLITNNPDGLTFSNIGPMYFRASNTGPFVQNSLYLDQYLQLPEQKEAIRTWTSHAPVATAKPRLRGQLTPEENSRVASKQTSISTYVDEMFLKFVMNQEPISNFDAYVEQIKQMGVDEIIELRTKAHERFMEANPDFDSSADLNVDEFYGLSVTLQ